MDHNYTRSDYGHGPMSPGASTTSLNHGSANASTVALAALVEEGLGYEPSSVVAARISMLHLNERGGQDREGAFVPNPKWTIGEEGEDEVSSVRHLPLCMV